MGTRTLRMTSPLGRAVSLRSSPTGSGRAATARMPSAMLSTRAGERERRSIMTGAITPRAASTSAALAARILSAWSSKAWAMASSRRFFSAVESAAAAGFTARAAQSRSAVVMSVSSFKTGRSMGAARQAWAFPRKRVPTGFPSTMSYRQSGSAPLAMTMGMPCCVTRRAARSFVTMPPVP